MNEIIHVIFLSIGSLTTLFLLAKLMGRREISEMSMFDYINGITIGSIAAEMATSLEENFLQPLTAMIVYGVGTALLSFICSKSIRTRRLIDGKPIILLKGNNLYLENFRKAKLDLTEFLEQCRINGYFDISQLQSAVFEVNGKISFQPKAMFRNATPSDLSLIPTPTGLAANVILDGKIMYQDLTNIEKDKDWLLKELSTLGCSSVADVLLATCDSEGKLTVYFMENDGQGHKDLLS